MRGVEKDKEGKGGKGGGLLARRQEINGNILCPENLNGEKTALHKYGFIQQVMYLCMYVYLKCIYNNLRI